MASAVRTIAERLARGRVIKKHMAFKGQNLPIYVSPDAQLKYLKNSFDQDLLDLANRFVVDGSNVWDIGANLGVFALAASYAADDVTVIAVEPDGFLQSIIDRTIEIHPEKNIKTLAVAVSHKTGVAEFMIASRGRASNALREAGGRSQMGGIRALQLVPTMTLDTLKQSFGVPDFIKVDVEGAEVMVLQGGEDTLRNARPLIYTEIGRDQFESVKSIVSPFDYILRDSKGRLTPSPDEANYYIIPEEKDSHWFS